MNTGFTRSVTPTFLIQCKVALAFLWAVFLTASAATGFGLGEDGEEGWDPAGGEAALPENPDDLSLRIRLIEYYHAQYADPDARERRVPHVLWLIEHHPRHPMSGDVRARLHPVLNDADFKTGSAFWKQHVEEHPEDPVIAGNAARYLAAGEREAALSFFQRAAELDADNPAWPVEKARLRRLAAAKLNDRESSQAQDLLRLAWADLERALELSHEREQRFDILIRIPELALEAGDSQQAGQRARELLEEAERFPVRHWNRANAIHAAHTTLGRVALREEDILSAGRHLLLSAQVRGSPQLNSFGPSIILAREFLARGETDAVITFLHLAGNFWVAGRTDLDRWTDEIRGTGTTDFPRRFAESP